MNTIHIDPDIIPLMQCVTITGGRPGYLTVRFAVLSGEIAGQKVGAVWLISKRSLIAWLKQRERKQELRQAKKQSRTHASV